MGDRADIGKTNWIRRWFPERQIYLRADGEIRGYAISPRKQMIMACIAGLVTAWTLTATGAVVVDAIGAGQAEDRMIRERAGSERRYADLQARLDTAVIRMTATTGSADQTALMIERRHAALTGVMSMFQGVSGARSALAPASPLPADTLPSRRLQAVQLDQERLIARAGLFAQNRAERLRLAFRLAGLNPAAYSVPGGALGGPLIAASDPDALAAILDVDPAFALRISHASAALSSMRRLTDAAQSVPLDRPTVARTTSGFGVRFDPFNGRPALHQGQDFAAPLNTPIKATAPGVISFAGIRSGYGNTVEIDHGRGFKTRFAHLNAISVQSGQSVALGQRIGAMGTTGRSTGVHLHYEVWVNGRPQNPARFLKAGETLVQQND